MRRGSGSRVQSVQFKMATEPVVGCLFTIDQNHQNHIMRYHSASSKGQASKFYTDEMDTIIVKIADVVLSPDSIKREKRGKKYVMASHNLTCNIVINMDIDN